MLCAEAEILGTNGSEVGHGIEHELARLGINDMVGGKTLGRCVILEQRAIAGKTDNSLARTVRIEHTQNGRGAHRKINIEIGYRLDIRHAPLLLGIGMNLLVYRCEQLTAAIGRVGCYEYSVIFEEQYIRENTAVLSHLCLYSIAAVQRKDISGLTNRYPYRAGGVEHTCDSLGTSLCAGDAVDGSRMNMQHVALCKQLVKQRFYTRAAILAGSTCSHHIGKHRSLSLSLAGGIILIPHCAESMTVHLYEFAGLYRRQRGARALNEQPILVLVGGISASRKNKLGIAPVQITHIRKCGKLILKHLYTLCLRSAKAPFL